MAHSKSVRAVGWSPRAFTEARVAANVTLQELSDRLGVPRSTVAAWGEKRVPKAALVPLIARALKVKRDALLG